MIKGSVIVVGKSSTRKWKRKNEQEKQKLAQVYRHYRRNRHTFVETI